MNIRNTDEVLIIRGLLEHFNAGRTSGIAHISVRTFFSGNKLGISEIKCLDTSKDTCYLVFPSIQTRHRVEKFLADTRREDPNFKVTSKHPQVSVFTSDLRLRNRELNILNRDLVK